MRDDFFGDKQDMVKWALLRIAATRFGYSLIVQVLMLRPGSLQRVSIGEIESDVPDDVFRMLRNLHVAEQGFDGVQVKVFDREFSGERVSFFDALIDYLKTRDPEPGVVFLDPDTGLRDNYPSFGHVTSGEVRRVWDTLQRKDCLALYQHNTNRKGRPWIEDKRSDFAAAVGVKDQSVLVGKPVQNPPQAVIFFAFREPN